MKKIKVFLVMVSIICIMGFECQPIVIIPSDGTTSGGTGTGTGTTTDDTIRLVFAGDTILARGVKNVVISNGSGSYQYPFQYIGDFLRNADVAFLNLESIISDAGTPADPAAVLLGTSFRADPAAINGLTYAGINVVSVANDHAFDYGREGFDNSLQRLKNAGISYIGGGTFNESYTAKYFIVKGTIVAFLAFTNLGNEYLVRAQQVDATQRLSAQTGVAWFYTKYAGPAINLAKKLANVVIVSLHMGQENQTLPDVYQDRYAHYCIDQGANLVVGHHPGAIQPVMVYMNGYIAHSLGNLITDQDGTNAKKGMVLEVVVHNKKIEQVNRKYVQINGTYQPVIQ
jgi:Putative enzyme of poly-gamma-glutamate biosynthesis (capsule formation)